MADTSIQWTDATWNPVRGCARVSPGCEHCYAERQAHRFSGKGEAYEGLTVLGKHGPRWAGRARFIPEMLDAPLRWKRPRRVFVNSMSDLFHVDVTDEQIAAIFGVMAACPQHTFQILTKRPERMLEWLNQDISLMQCAGLADQLGKLSTRSARGVYAHFDDEMGETDLDQPLPNVWLGTSCEDQQRADERVHLLLACPAAIRFVSLEPLLGPIEMKDWWLTRRDPCHFVPFSAEAKAAYGQEGDRMLVRRGIDWVIVGGESGPGARPCHVQWIRSIVQQCADAGVPCFVKQLGATIRVPDSEQLGDVETGWTPYARTSVSDDNLVRLPDSKGGEISEWPDDLRVRQFPEAHP